MSRLVAACGTFLGPVASAGIAGNEPVRQTSVATSRVCPSETTAADAMAKSAARPFSCRSGAPGSVGSAPVVSLINSPVTLASGPVAMGSAPVARAVAETAGKAPVAAAVRA